MYDICKQVVMILVLALLFLLVLKTKQYGGRMIKGRGDDIMIFLRHPKETVAINVDVDDTVKNLYQKVPEELNTSLLSFAGNILYDNDTPLSELGIGAESVIDIVENLPVITKPENVKEVSVRAVRNFEDIILLVRIEFNEESDPLRIDVGYSFLTDRLDDLILCNEQDPVRVEGIIHRRVVCDSKDVFLTHDYSLAYVIVKTKQEVDTKESLEKIILDNVNFYPGARDKLKEYLFETKGLNNEIYRSSLTRPDLSVLI